MTHGPMNADAGGPAARVQARLRADWDRVVAGVQAWPDRSRAPSGALGRISRAEDVLTVNAERHRTLAWLGPAAVVCLAGIVLSAILLALPIGFGFSLDGQRVIDSD